MDLTSSNLTFFLIIIFALAIAFIFYELIFKDIKSFWKAYKEGNAKSYLPNMKSFTEAFVIAFVAAMIFRVFLYEPFHIPSGSMRPTLEVSDYIFVSKYDYGYSKHTLPFSIPLIKNRIFSKMPERGDIVVFRLPSEPKTKYIKRVIGLPGDKIQVIDGIVFVNDVPLKQLREKDYIDTKGGKKRLVKQYIEILPNNTTHMILDYNSHHPFDNTKLFHVPENHLFCMGDNRDNSQDSRAREVGFIPFDNVIGKARFFFKTAEFPLFNITKWFDDKYNSRMFKKIQ